MRKNTKSKVQSPKSKVRLVWLLFCLVIVAVYFFGLNIPLLGPDEPRYAQIGREMLERADWITPKLGGFDWFEKPALLYWLEIVSYKIFGITEFAARFSSAIFGLGTIFCLWILGKFSAAENTEEEEKNKDVENSVSFSKNSLFPAAQTNFADWLALISATSIGLIAFSHAASFDIIITFPITASLVGFFIFDLSQKPKSKDQPKTESQKPQPATRFIALFAFYFFIGIALIAKGLIGIIFPFAIVGFYYVLSRKLPNKIFVFSLFWGTILSLLVAAVWYLPMYQTNGWKFIDEFIVQHHFQRFTSDKYKHHQPFWFFLVVLPLMTLPWLPFFLASIWNLLKNQSPKSKVQSPKSTDHASQPEILFNAPLPTEIKSSKRFFFLPLSLSPLLLFSLAWLLVPLVFFSVSGSKLPGYILPALPAALILTADFVYKFARKSAKRDFWVKFTAFATLALVAVTIKFFVDDYARNDTVKYLIETANERGYANDKIACIYEVSHSLEFYAPNRLIRETDGKLKYYKEFLALTEDAKNQPNRELLVIAPREPAKMLVNDKIADSEILAENDESAILIVKPK